MAFNIDAVPQKFEALAQVIGQARGAALVPWLHELKQRIGIAPRLSAAGVKREQFTRLVEIATADMCHQTNPRPCTAADFERFFEAAF